MKYTQYLPCKHVVQMRRGREGCNQRIGVASLLCLVWRDLSVARSISTLRTTPQDALSAVQKTSIDGSLNECNDRYRSADRQDEMDRLCLSRGSQVNEGDHFRICGDRCSESLFFITPLQFGWTIVSRWTTLCCLGDSNVHSPS